MNILNGILDNDSSNVFLSSFNSIVLKTNIVKESLSTNTSLTSINRIKGGYSIGGISFNSSLLYLNIAVNNYRLVKENLKGADSISNNNILNLIVNQEILFTSNVLIHYLEILNNQISFNSSINYNRISINSIINNLKINSNDINIIVFNEYLLEILSILSSDIFIDNSTISENINIINNIINVILSYNIVFELINYSDPIIYYAVSLITSSNDILNIDSVDSSSLYNILSSSEIQLIIGQQDSDKYISYLLEPETFSTSTYSNYNFSQSTKFNNKYIFSNKEGLYEYGSEYDDGEIITARIQTAALDFGTSNLKQMPYFYIGVTNSNKLVLKLSVDGKASVYYKLNKKTDYLSNQKISIGKGLIGRYFQFELITEENTDFNMESIEFTPLVLRRKL